MVIRRRQLALAFCVAGTCLYPNTARAQGTARPPDAAASDGQHEQMHMPMNNGWQFMQDGIVFAEFNDQGGPRGGSEFVVPNWWMGMASRATSRGQLTPRHGDADESQDALSHGRSRRASHDNSPVVASRLRRRRQRQALVRAADDKDVWVGGRSPRHG